MTPLQMAIGYAAFANGGFRIAPYFIQRIEDERGKVLEQAKPVLAGGGAKQIIDPRNAFLMTSMMQDVVQRGTATKADSSAVRISQEKPAPPAIMWTHGFAVIRQILVAIAWIGFDNPKSLGNNETGRPRRLADVDKLYGDRH